MNNTIEKQVEMAAPVSRVWQALTDHRQFGQWFRVKMSGPFIVGKEATGEVLHPCWEGRQFSVMVKAIEPEKLFAFTWNPYPKDPTVDYTKEPPTLVEFKLSPTKTGTLLTVTESGFDNITAHRRLEAFRMNEGGWTEQMKNIAEYIAHGATATT